MRRKKRPLQMDPHRSRALERRVHQFRQSAQRTQQRLQRRRHRSCAIRTHATPRQECADAVQRVLRRLHHIVPARAVDVNVEQRRNQRHFRQIHVAPIGQFSLILRSDVGDDAVVDHYDGPVDCLIGS
jgi:hypothetical protein